MDSRTAAHALSRIAAYLELSGQNQFKTRAYRGAAAALMALGSDDLAPLLRSGELARTRGLGPATIAVVRDLVETGESRYLEELRRETPEGLLELLPVPGLGVDTIRRLYQELDIRSLDDLERAARENRLTKMKGMGPKTASKILKGIEFMRSSGARVLYPRARQNAAGLLAAIRSHPDVQVAETAGSLRRQLPVIADVDVVAGCSGDPVLVAESFARVPGVRRATLDESGTSACIIFADDVKLDLHCVRPSEFAVAWWRATGSEKHVRLVAEKLAAHGLHLDGNRITGASGREVSCPDEDALYRLAGLAWIPPELREATGEVDAAASGTLPALLEMDDLRGALHCHTRYSDGKSTIAEMADAAEAKGWQYLGISDHSQAAFYASGVSREDMLEQLDEIDDLNARRSGLRLLKGVEADILADGRLDYDEDLLDRFDYVIASIHSRFRMDGAAMTERVLHAMDDPHMTILAHPTGRLLLAREPYDLDLDAVLEKAAERGVALELNCDPRRMDLDWSFLSGARERGAAIAIGPDAHSRTSLDNMEFGVGAARKGWLRRGDVLNARDVEGVLAFARARRS